MLIGTGNLSAQSLAGKTAVVIGEGRGIGYETVQSLLWLGARVVIAEIDAEQLRVIQSWREEADLLAKSLSDWN